MRSVLERKFIVILLLCILHGQDMLAQKKMVDEQAIENWQKMGSPSISNDGRYVSYHHWNGAGMMGGIEHKNPGSTIQSANGSWKRVFPTKGYSEVIFNNTSTRAVLLTSGDSLRIVHLGKNDVQIIPEVSQFKLVKLQGKEYLFIRKQDATRTLVCMELNGSVKKTYKEVADFWVSDNQATMIVAQEKENDIYLQWIDLSNGREQTIWHGPTAGNLVFNKEGTSVSFMVDREEHKQLFLSVKGSFAQELIPNAANEKGWVTDRVDRFSDDGQRLFVRISPLKKTTPSTSSSLVRVSRFDDTRLSLSEAASKPMRSFLSVINIADGKSTRLERENETFSFPDCESDLYGMLIYQTESFYNEDNWNPAAKRTCMLISTITGEKITPQQFDEFSGCSPNGRYFIGYDRNREHLYCFEVNGNKTTDLSARFSGMDISYSNPRPDIRPVGALSLIGWLGGDSLLILKDHYDIWEINLATAEKAHCLTLGEGRKHEIIFGFARDIKKDKRLVLSKKYILGAFNERTKENGFYELERGVTGRLKKLVMSNAACYAPGTDHSGISPVKAAQADVWLVQRQSATESPNYFITSDFKKFAAATHIQPQVSYRWYTNELIQFKSLDGQGLQGVLYKPEDFDPSKKYPIVFLYYEDKSDKLNFFLEPELAMDEINIPWYTSRGYLVFTPDLAYTIGDPMKTAFHAFMGGVNAVVKLSYVDSTRMGLKGHSFGGYETYYILTHSNRFAAAVPSAGVSNLFSHYGSVQQKNRLVSGMLYEKGQTRMGKTPWEAREKYVENSPIFYADRINTPILIMHNKSDAIVPQAQGFEFYLALRRLQKKAWFLQYEGEAHSLIKKESMRDYTLKMDQFFGHYLKREPMPDWMKPQAEREAEMTK